MIGIVLGIMGQILTLRATCPMYAMKYDIDGDGRLSHEEFLQARDTTRAAAALRRARAR